MTFYCFIQKIPFIFGNRNKSGDLSLVSKYEHCDAVSKEIIKGNSVKSLESFLNHLLMYYIILSIKSIVVKTKINLKHTALKTGFIFRYSIAKTTLYIKGNFSPMYNNILLTDNRWLSIIFICQNCYTYKEPQTNTDIKNNDAKKNAHTGMCAWVILHSLLYCFCDERHACASNYFIKGCERIKIKRKT